MWLEHVVLSLRRVTFQRARGSLRRRRGGAGEAPRATRST